MHPEIDPAKDVLPLDLAVEDPRVHAFFDDTPQLQHAAKQRKVNGMAKTGAVIKVNGRLKVVVPRLVDWGLNHGRNAA